MRAQLTLVGKQTETFSCQHCGVSVTKRRRWERTAKFCSQRCASLAREAVKREAAQPRTLEYFQERSVVDPITGCWVWQGATDDRGYGFTNEKGEDGVWRAVRVHRQSYEIANGVKLGGLKGRHSCDNPPCCNPDHILPGTQRDNVHDCIQRGRFKMPTKSTVRENEEWIGATPDARIPARVKSRVLERHGDRCAICTRAFDHKVKPEFDHTVALVNGGENREANLRPLCPGCHKPKTSMDVKMKAARAKDRREKFGLQPKKRSSFPTAKGSKWKAKVGGGVVRREED